MNSLKEFADTLPDYAKDIRLNLSSILSDQLLGEQRKYGLLLSCAHGSAYRPLVAAAEAECAPKLSEAERGIWEIAGQAANEHHRQPWHRKGRFRTFQPGRQRDEWLRHVHRQP